MPAAALPAAPPLSAAAPPPPTLAPPALHHAPASQGQQQGCVHPDEQLRERLRGGQAPKAVVLTCSDSRMPPELIFDQARNLPLHLACFLLRCAYRGCERQATRSCCCTRPLTVRCCHRHLPAFGDHLLWCGWVIRCVLLGVQPLLFCGTSLLHAGLWRPVCGAGGGQHCQRARAGQVGMRCGAGGCTGVAACRVGRGVCCGMNAGCRPLSLLSSHHTRITPLRCLALLRNAVLPSSEPQHLVRAAKPGHAAGAGDGAHQVWGGQGGSS